MQNSHRAVRFNDNLDGTLTELDTYCDPTQSYGKNSGGWSKPPIIVSKRTMTLIESPMVEPSHHINSFSTKATVPAPVTRRGGPRRSSGLPKKVDSEESDFTVADDESVTTSGTRKDISQRASSPTGPSRFFKMANPDRPYDMYPGKSECPVIKDVRCSN
jgi:hypothetical protein